MQKMHFNLKIHAKKGENAFSISKFIQIKAKMEKRKHIYLDFYTCAFLCKPKNAKKSYFFAYVFYKFEKKISFFLHFFILIFI